MNRPVEDTSTGSNRRLANVSSVVESEASRPEDSRTPLHRLFCCRGGLVGAATDLPPRTSPPSKLDSEPFEVHSTG